MFPVKRGHIGYYSTTSFCETFSAIASIKVIKVIKGLCEKGIPITFYTPF